MGVSRSPAELARKFDTAARQIGDANTQAVTRAAQVYKDAVLSEARNDVGADLRLSRWGRRGVKLGANYRVRRGPQARATLTPRPAGVWSALSSGTAPHEITPRRRGRRRRGGAQALAMPDGGFAAVVQHPGTRGKRTWQRGVESGRSRAITAFRQRHRSALVRVFR